MKRIYLVFALALLSCSVMDQALKKTSSTPEPSLLESTKQILPSPTVDESGANIVYVAPFCTILGEEDTQTEEYGNAFELSWGWKAQTEQQVFDYIEAAITKVTFNEEEITDAEQTDVYEEGGTYHVFWWKSMGVLERGKYKMTFFEKYETEIFDGWDYFGPGTDNVSTEDTCYLIVE